MQRKQLTITTNIPSTTRIIGGALALLLSSVSAFALPAQPAGPQLNTASRAAILLAQAEAPAAEQPIVEPAEEPVEKPAPKKKPKAEAPAEAPAAEPAQAEQPAAEPAQAEQPARKKRPEPEAKAEQPAAEPAPAQEPVAEPTQAEQPAEKPARKKPVEAEAPAEQPAPEAKPAAEEPAVEQPAEKPKRPKKPQAEAAPAEQPAVNEPSPEAKPESGAKPAEQPAEKPAKPAKPKAETPAAEKPAAGQPAAEPAANGDAPAKPSRPHRPKAEQPANGEPAAEQPGAQPATGEAPADAPARPKRPRADNAPNGAPDGQAPAAPTEAGQTPTKAPPPIVEAPKPNDGARAPVFDSQKPDRRDGSGKPRRPRPQQDAQPATPPAPPPTSDKAATEAAQPREIIPVTRERGERRRDARPPEEFDRPAGSEVIRKLGDRIIINLGGQAVVESDDRERMGRGARDVYYEDLPRGRTREVIERPDGSQLITVRNSNGDILRRSRISPDGREYVLNYVEEDRYDEGREWRDPGDDLPPMQIDIPEDEYILRSDRVRNNDDYYEFLSEPPVERVERLYSVDEVKRSARVRDKTRRVDLDTITFAFGKADVPEDQVSKLEGVAGAMERMLKANPAESFLIEGHTDAVGTDEANLALSDRRAEAVADALTNVFGIPPENLATQGYGEEYLKVRTQEPERENRRVAIRRITPLVAPVAQAQ